MSQLAPLPILQPITSTRDHISPPPRPLSFVDILDKAKKKNDDRTNEHISDYLSSMEDYQTLDGFRRLIQAQAQNLNTQFPRLDFLINSAVTLVTFISVHFNTYIYRSPFQT